MPVEKTEGSPLSDSHGAGGANQAGAAVLQVAVDTPLRQALEYLPPPGVARETIVAGSRLWVPLGRRRVAGVVVGQADRSSLAPERLRAALGLIDQQPLLDPALLQLLRWTSEYYHHPLGEVVAAAMPVALREGAPADALTQWLALTEAGRIAGQQGEPRRAPRQRELMVLLGQGSGRLAADALDAALPRWRELARSLGARGWTTLAAERAAAPSPPETTAASAGPALSAEQDQAVQSIDAARGSFAAFVLQGATGSGKTEVYIQATARALGAGGSVLVLVPEIGLTPQLVGRFRERFAVPIAVLHSGLGDAERLAAWRQARSGQARIVIGTRSAVFAPLRSLALIIVDEEHDSSFKQQEGGCRYSARDLAVRRAQLGALPVVLGSATPALETLQNLQRGRYRRLPLPRRAGQAPPPKLALIDLRAHPAHAGLATPVLQNLQRHLDAGGQALVYINRRGYAPTLLCTGCGWMAPCRACDARLTVHQKAGRLRCHHCGADQPLPAHCPRCGHAVKAVGQGTERIEETLAAQFPGAGLARLDRDSARTAGGLESVVEAMTQGTARILVGTQMITKGHHFPAVTLVVVLNADGGLFSTDFRAAERLAQTIVQVAGRAGREATQGEVLIQTEYPDHPLLQSLLAEGYEGFAAAALAERAAARWPPFSRLAALRCSATDMAAALGFLASARTLAGQPPGITLLGPVAAGMARRAGRHHAQLLVESAERATLHRFLEPWLRAVDGLPTPRQLRWSLDVDPLDTQ